MEAPFAAALLAGGLSSRMGTDKALLRLPDGRMLWERQLDVLRALGPAELYISGLARKGFETDVPFIPDEVAGQGPLGGITAVLGAMRSPRLVVLAVDMPKMNTQQLRRTLSHADQGAGVGCVPRFAFFEPLAAVYPREAHPIARRRLSEGKLSMQAFVNELLEASLVEAWPIATEEQGLFVNWNTPLQISPS